MINTKPVTPEKNSGFIHGTKPIQPFMKSSKKNTETPKTEKKLINANFCHKIQKERSEEDVESLQVDRFINNYNLDARNSDFYENGAFKSNNFVTAEATKFEVVEEEELMASSHEMFHSVATRSIVRTT